MRYAAGCYSKKCGTTMDEMCCQRRVRKNILFFHLPLKQTIVSDFDFTLMLKSRDATLAWMT